MGWLNKNAGSCATSGHGRRANIHASPFMIERTTHKQYDQHGALFWNECFLFFSRDCRHKAFKKK
jgi:hypothetical protein